MQTDGRRACRQTDGGRADGRTAGVQTDGRRACRQTDAELNGGVPSWGLGPHMEVGDVLPVQGLGDGQLAGDGVDDVDARGGLVGPGARHAVAQEAVLVPVRTDLAAQEGERHDNVIFVIFLPPPRLLSLNITCTWLSPPRAPPPHQGGRGAAWRRSQGRREPCAGAPWGSGGGQRAVLRYKHINGHDLSAH